MKAWDNLLGTGKAVREAMIPSGMRKYQKNQARGREK
jgi:hypothetical protein